MFPYEFKDQFKELGFDDINNPKYGAWWQMNSHRSNAKGFNKIWNEFLVTKPTLEGILKKGKELAKEYKLKITFKK